MSYIRRGLTLAETRTLASLPGLPVEALALLEVAREERTREALTIGPERGMWFHATVDAFEALQRSRVDYRWGRTLHRVRVPAPWVVYRDRQGRVKVGEREQRVPAPEHFPGGVYPRGTVDLGRIA